MLIRHTELPEKETKFEIGCPHALLEAKEIQ